MRSAGKLPAQRRPRDAKCRAAIDLLIASGAAELAHASDRSLLTHLVGTARLLLAWNAPIDTVRAGLCHSIYGTNAFRKASIAHTQRPVLQRVIGRRAEALVWLFSRLQRPATLLRATHHGTTLVKQRSGRTRHLDSSALQQLFILECANLFDQGVSMARARQLHGHATRLPWSPSLMVRAMQRQRRDAHRARCNALKVLRKPQTALS
ncbi:MAG: hypothetical protein JWL63_1763 [Rhodocyclales bacterium]|nr:hypothetical protein [Rhodocyclales bacterium]